MVERTTKVEFGAGPYMARLLRAAMKDARKLFEEAVEAAAERRPNAGITSFDRWARSHEHASFYWAVFGQAINDAERLLGASADLAESIAVLLDTGGRSIVSPLVLPRSLGEAVLRICHTFDPNVPPARTLVRMAAFQLEGVEGNLRTARAFGRDADDEAERAAKNIAEMHAMFAAHGIERGPGRVDPFTAWLRLEGETENLEFNATDAYKRHTPRDAWAWSLGSGATHSRGWMLPSLVGTTNDEPLSSTIETYVATSGAVLELGDAFASVAAAHADIGVDWFLKKNHLRRRGMLSWTARHTDLAVDHREYASRGASWEPSPGYLGDAFRAER